LLCDVDAQVLVGIEIPAAVLAKGIDLHHSIQRPMFRHLFRMGLENTNSRSISAESATTDRATQLKQAASTDECANLVTEWFSSKLGQVLGLSTLDIEPSKPIHHYGVDSLVAIDLRNWLERETGADITVFELLGNMPLRDLSTIVAEKSRYRQ
jgi:aryl carrier-like protein